MASKQRDCNVPHITPTSGEGTAEHVGQGTLGTALQLIHFSPTNIADCFAKYVPLYYIYKVKLSPQQAVEAYRVVRC
jgi:hypothetical protein